MKILPTKPLPFSTALRAAFDYDVASGRLTWKWRVDAPLATNRACAGKVAGSLRVKSCGYRYRAVRFNYVLHAEHRLIWVLVTGDDITDFEIDHRNGDATDNNWWNLRRCNRAQQMRNVKARGAWPKGVCWDKERSLFSAKLKVDGRTINLGRFSDPQVAHEAYKRAAAQHFGEYMCVR